MHTSQFNIDYSTDAGIPMSPLGDCHIGNIGYSRDELLKDVDYIAKGGNLTVLMGDIIDGINMDDKRFDPRTVTNNLDRIVTEQIDEAIEIFSRIPKENIIGVHTGNHEETVRHRYCRDATYEIARALGVPNLGWESWTRLRFKRPGHTEVLKLASAHGNGGGRKMGAKLNKMEEFVSHRDADIYLLGHTHFLNAGVGIKTSIKSSGKLGIWYKEYAYMNTGSYLKGAVDGVITYPERSGFTPLQTGCGTIFIWPEKRKYKIMY